MKVFMLGWEFPPFISGGLGTACYGLTKAMSQVGIEIIFLLPRPVKTSLSSHVKMVSPVVNGSHEQPKTAIPYDVIENLTFRHIDSPLQPYETSETYFESVDQVRKEAHVSDKSTRVQQTLDMASANYGSDLCQEVHRYSQLAVSLPSKSNSM